MTVLVEVQPDGTPDEQEALARDLRDEFGQVGLAVDFAAGARASATEKSADAIAYAILALPLLSDPATVQAALNCLFGWLPRQRSCTLRLRRGQDWVEVSDLSGKDARSLVEQFLEASNSTKQIAE